MKTGLLGNNIGYSKSPQIHNEYYIKNGLPFEYEIFDIEEEQLSNFISKLKSKNIIGFNVTIPYKQKIMRFLDEIDENAKKIGAVNTVLYFDNKLKGYNTDYYGFIKSLKENKIDVKGKNALIIGSGGVAKCVFNALLYLNIKKMKILTRNRSEAATYFNESTIIEKTNYIDLSQYDLIFNCTPIGGANYPDQVPVNLTENLKNDLIVYDLNYIPSISKLLMQSKNRGIRVLNGKDMLKFQAYEAINIWASHYNNFNYANIKELEGNK